ncbi:DNA transposase THAP9 [Holothuria leucospilota]|uniref:DNA transposase THAP9 n=1 Tax=Holothuria leucospilota TaxID=206669 RepID=A0A9Q1CRB4_HOLLE|nr:DNA transposase THAP9 [Holothuria leucospilota]
MFDAMALKKVVYDPKNGNYGGFVDCSNILPSESDSLATEALVFMAVGLTSNWKFPVAYYLVDHQPGAIQAEMVRQLISILTEAGLVVHGVVCDGSYANQNTSSLLGCSVTPTGLKHFFPHPKNPNEKVYFIFDTCHLIKLIRNCFATYGTIYHQEKQIMWSYIEKLHEVQQKDNLNLANKVRAKHVLWQQHKMNVKLAVQALSSSVADAIDFLRDDLHLPQFSGSDKTTEFIRIVDKLFDFMNSRSPHAKGYKQPIRLTNLTGRKKWLMETKEYLGELKDATGQPLTKCRRKTAWVGFMMTIKSVTEICHNLLSNSQPAYYVCTFKMSQDHLESFFSRIQRRGGWNNNPNCLQFKWALRAILQKNSIMPSKSANISIDEPENALFIQRKPASVRKVNESMQKFANLLHEPSEFHDHILHYIAGYVSKHVMEHCKCTKCCIALHNQNAHDGVNDHSYCADGTHACFTKTKDRGGLRKARDDVFKIVKTTDNVFRWVPLGITYQYFNSKLFHSFLIFANTAEPCNELLCQWLWG